MNKINVTGSYVKNSQIGVFTGSHINVDAQLEEKNATKPPDIERIQSSKRSLSTAWKNAPIVNSIIQLLRALHFPI